MHTNHFFLTRVQSSVPVKDIVDNLLEDLSELLSLGEDGPRTLISEVNEINAGELAVGLAALRQADLDSTSISYAETREHIASRSLFYCYRPFSGCRSAEFHLVLLVPKHNRLEWSDIGKSLESMRSPNRFRRRGKRNLDHLITATNDNGSVFTCHIMVSFSMLRFQ